MDFRNELFSISDSDFSGQWISGFSEIRPSTHRKINRAILRELFFQQPKNLPQDSNDFWQAPEIYRNQQSDIFGFFCFQNLKNQ